jgi:hypothetical protein
MKAPVVVVAMLGAAFAAANTQASASNDRLATRPGWEVGGQVAHYRYLEPGFMKLEGDRAGILGAYTFTGAGGLFSRIDVRGSYGQLEYRGTGTKSGVPDWLIETRAVVGVDVFPGSGVSLSPYVGLGNRHLYNDLRGYGSTGAVGYRRYSNYLYAPLGLTVRIRVGGGWILAPTLEGDLFIRGRQVSKLSDAGLGFLDVTNSQDKGYGYRYSFMVEKDRWAFGGWTHYWHIRDSDSRPIGGGRVGREPENYTWESGLEIRYRF